MRFITIKIKTKDAEILFSDLESLLENDDSELMENGFESLFQLRQTLQETLEGYGETDGPVNTEVV